MVVHFKLEVVPQIETGPCAECSILAHASSEILFGIKHQLFASRYIVKPLLESVEHLWKLLRLIDLLLGDAGQLQAKRTQLWVIRWANELTEFGFDLIGGKIQQNGRKFCEQMKNHFFKKMQIENSTNLALTDNLCNISTRFAWPASGFKIQTHKILNGHCYSE